ncbi:MAG TPA: hypothetical protein DDW27_10350, partial [Bacteroidales bacterium]|nr:hypothetical protein [Bacteroidales bacterium]
MQKNKPHLIYIMPERTKLFELFPPVSTEEWMNRIKSDLKGEDFNNKLVWKTSMGFDVMPFYRLEDIEYLRYIDIRPGEMPFIRGEKTVNNNWKIRQDVKVTDYADANRKALTLIEGGTDSIGFHITNPDSITTDNFKILLKDTDPETIELNFLSDGRATELLTAFSNTIKDYSSGKISGAVETDPLSRLMLNGKLCIPVEKGFDYLAEVAQMTTSLPLFRAVHINSSNFRNAGADIVTELAFAISMGVEYLFRFAERDIFPGVASGKIRFSFGTGPEYFPEIAKLRAARLLWSVVMNAFKSGTGVSAQMEIHSVTIRLNKTTDDPYINMLRTQTEAMSAILGGADSITVEPYDIVFKQPDEFSERIARNQQLILREEAWFGKVADPAGGSYYIEKLTDLIAKHAWKLFLEIENYGGFVKALEKGVIKQKISEKAMNLKSRYRKNLIYLPDLIKVQAEPSVTFLPVAFNRPEFSIEDLDEIVPGKGDPSVKLSGQQSEEAWITPEGMAVKSFYTERDLAG